MLYDCTLAAFWGEAGGAEADLFDLRLHELDGVVDGHVLVEADRTFMGQPKPYVYPTIASRYAAFADRIHYRQIELEPTDRNHRAQGGLQWQHRNATTALAPAGDWRDILMISDIDEIPRAQILAQLKTAGWTTAVQLGQAMYLFWLDLAVRSDVSEAPGQRAWWNGPLLVRRHNLERTSAFDLRNIPGRPLVPDAGWHFSFLGDHQQDLQKLAGWGDAEEPSLRPSRAADNVEEARIFGRDWNLERRWNLEWVADADNALPAYVWEHPEIFERHFGAGVPVPEETA